MIALEKETNKNTHFITDLAISYHGDNQRMTALQEYLTPNLK